MKETDKISMQAFIAAAIFTGGLWYFIPGLPWWAYLIVLVLVAGGVYQERIKTVSQEKIIDRGDWPNKGDQ
ncbi:hypothetical protein [Mesorhizobium sp. M7A.F.Ca.US.010.02.1.1]|uniref:hypothetical protein n=1 Tax=Mesorhizobium sp. M7A.F.Ca.US.010.02.1.1 TaxID=2496743 RepID=UPI000FD4F2BB|nr:hypothetical protein [Mesorhizobium sp. M7A.F.Ca.US.010.02.1.1]RUW92060.1 hypothetical protein EOA19_11815 [Mesorhizobium sp. M7A.F.Ca.US.010.02.1.1]